jgi:hypothetical protein
MTGLRASTNNKVSTVLELFLDAILAYGIPSRVRGDRGGENRDVAILMILLRGADRGSYLWGSSTHNSRIERMWVEIGTQFARQWRAFFLWLEQYHHLNRTNASHLWLLQTLFLEHINQDCKRFRQDWNSHPLSGKGNGGNQSPNVIFISHVSKNGLTTLCRIFNYWANWSLGSMMTMKMSTLNSLIDIMVSMEM